MKTLRYPPRAAGSSFHLAWGDFVSSSVGRANSRPSSRPGRSPQPFSNPLSSCQGTLSARNIVPEPHRSSGVRSGGVPGARRAARGADGALDLFSAPGIASPARLRQRPVWGSAGSFRARAIAFPEAASEKLHALSSTAEHAGHATRHTWGQPKRCRRLLLGFGLMTHSSRWTWMRLPWDEWDEQIGLPRWLELPRVARSGM